jgi:hypothetical protein
MISGEQRVNTKVLSFDGNPAQCTKIRTVLSHLQPNSHSSRHHNLILP